MSARVARCGLVLVATVAAVALCAPASSGATKRAAASSLPASIKAIMDKPRYADATWSLLVTDVETGETFYPLNADQISFTGSTRKLFSIGLALTRSAPTRAQTTPVYRPRRRSTADGTLTGDLVLVGGRRPRLSAAGGSTPTPSTSPTSTTTTPTASAPPILTPQDPLYALDQPRRAR